MSIDISRIGFPTDRFESEREMAAQPPGRLYRGRSKDRGDEVVVRVFSDPTSSVEGVADALRGLTADQKLAAGEHPLLLTAEVTLSREPKYLVTPVVVGRSLASVLESGERLTPLQVDSIIRALAGALSRLHQKGIAHGAIHPGNIFIGPDGAVAAITDIGRWRLRRAARVSPTLNVAFYLATEQALGEGATPASDIYALGALACALRTGQPPFPATEVDAALREHRRREPLEALSHTLTGLPSHAVEAIIKALSRDPALRYSSVEDFARTFTGGSAPRPDPVVRPVPVPAPIPEPVRAPTADTRPAPQLKLTPPVVDDHPEMKPGPRPPPMHSLGDTLPPSVSARMDVPLGDPRASRRVAGKVGVFAVITGILAALFLLIAPAPKTYKTDPVYYAQLKKRAEAGQDLPRQQDLKARITLKDYQELQNIATRQMIERKDQAFKALLDKQSGDTRSFVVEARENQRKMASELSSMKGQAAAANARMASLQGEAASANARLSQMQREYNSAKAKLRELGQE